MNLSSKFSLIETLYPKSPYCPVPVSRSPPLAQSIELIFVTSEQGEALGLELGDPDALTEDVTEGIGDAVAVIVGETYDVGTVDEVTDAEGVSLSLVLGLTDWLTLAVCVGVTDELDSIEAVADAETDEEELELAVGISL